MLIFLAITTNMHRVTIHQLNCVNNISKFKRKILHDLCDLRYVTTGEK